ncbi:MAG: hypothetical protein UY06_C0034G0001 [Candidatus Amesbacteria bacterium GW2011_GWA2_47_70]|uniref:SpoVT-AbrB domain-containing protein n=1 Tax=Candidatus Amesbacteria bacterium GW2011_GWC2_45_19 TaxID=1618366 RepID=A0A0G1M4M5_9BACT|nr:MAG: hypothetical protein UX05_C0004G0061 [Candidatus Amesbacteria bacterium GW2011_GWC2_45_19]KKU69222.1 MAG: hypothetical protein UX93_C0002G0061 [Microgenomates group bacterium GW2011_GWC1_47_20]KKU78968.1 MAG: hypothetical protein UY06_C0034G0001 [Candidatus Amesbacteria bacterium GW2011_GWA2_47_70]
MIQSVVQIGNSLGVTLPRDFVTKNKVTKNSKISVAHTDGSITYSTHIPRSTQYATAPDKEWFDLIKEVEKRYGHALKELAQLQ